jgi:hypothetical protein
VCINDSENERVSGLEMARERWSACESSESDFSKAAYKDGAVYVLFRGECGDRGFVFEMDGWRNGSGVLFMLPVVLSLSTKPDGSFCSWAADWNRLTAVRNVVEDPEDMIAVFWLCRGCRPSLNCYSCHSQ